MRVGSLFAGIGGFDLAFERAGCELLWQVENDKSCRSILEQRWPDVDLYEDARDVGKSTLAPVDLIVGGFPCQDLSVAGRREGLAGERSGLWYEFHRIIGELTPRWVLIEQVPGLLSSHGGRDFAVILCGLGKCGYGWSYRVLDSQNFGVPQRRRRVFVVGRLGSFCPPEILFEPESVQRDPAARSEARSRIADGSLSRALSRVGGGDDPGANKGAPGGQVAVFRKAQRAHHSDDCERWEEADQADTLDAIGHSPRTAHAVLMDRPRRLTPRECERLQGFPDDWTREGVKGEASDSARYRMLGNAVTVSVIGWIAARLMRYEQGDASL